MQVAKPRKYAYRWPRPMVTVDAVVFTVLDGRLAVLLVRRKNPPFEGRWALPGGFIEMDEPLEKAALRELEEETGVSGIHVVQLGAFGEDPRRDPRGRNISIAYMALVDWRRHPIRADDDAADVAWMPAGDLPQMAFDHADVVQTAVARLRAYTQYAGVGRQILPTQFALTDLRRVYEAVRGKRIRRREFEQRVLDMKIVRPVKNRPGRYRFCTPKTAPL